MLTGIGNTEEKIWEYGLKLCIGWNVLPGKG